MTYDDLNTLVHRTADDIERFHPIRMETADRIDLNDLLTTFLAERGVTFAEEEN